MLSARGQKDAALDQAASYTKNSGYMYDKIRHPKGLVSFGNAGNAGFQALYGHQDSIADTEVVDSFLCRMRHLIA